MSKGIDLIKILKPYTQYQRWLKRQQEFTTPQDFSFATWIAILFGLFVAVFLLVAVAGASEIDLSIIAKIESNNNPKAISYKGAKYGRGLYQISEFALTDYNAWHPTSKIDSKALFEPIEAQKVAGWYLSSRIPSLLRLGAFPLEIDYILICYNWGFGNFRKWYNAGADYNKLPQETKQYLKKYHNLSNNVR